MKKDKRTVAVILKPQGIRGELKVKAMTDSADTLEAFNSVLIDGAEYSVLSLRCSGEFAYMFQPLINGKLAGFARRGKPFEFFF